MFMLCQLRMSFDPHNGSNASITSYELPKLKIINNYLLRIVDYTPFSYGLPTYNYGILTTYYELRIRYGPAADMATLAPIS